MCDMLCEYPPCLDSLKMILLRVFAMKTALHRVDQRRKNQKTYAALNILEARTSDAYVNVYPTYAAMSRIGAETR